MRLIVWIFLLIGPCTLAFGLLSSLRTERFVARSQPGDATVINMRQVHDPTGNVPTFAPDFSFVTADGRTFVLPSRVSSNPPEFKVGDHVPIRYELDHPELARIATFGQLWGFGAGVVLLGFLATVISLTNLVIRSRRKLPF
jgi:hypothetical protein